MHKYNTLHARPGRSPRKERPQSFIAMMKCVLLALPITALLGALLLSLSTALLMLTKNPAQYTRTPAVFCLYFTAALGGLLATRLYGRRSPVLCGLFVGLLLMLCLAIPALFAPRNGNAAAVLIWRLLIPIASLAGALLAARKRNMRPRRARKR